MPLRRLAFASLAGLIALALGALGWRVLAAGGWSGWEVAILAAFALNLPWLALGGATGITGFLVLTLARDPERLLVPTPEAPLDAASAATPEAPLETAEEPPTLLAICVRDEDMAGLLPPLAALLGTLGGAHAIAILSDTTDPARGAAEDAAVARLAARFAPGRVLHRRRAANTGWKAGNVMEFLDRHAAGFEFLLLLDADSRMSPDLVRRLIRLMAASPRLALLQATIAGEPGGGTHFARLFTSGHAPGALCWAAGQAWWQGGEGAYWGHNALLRIAPFRQHCRLETLPDGAHLLSHDFVEAARLHAAGWEVRVLPVQGGSTERHPPDLPAFLDRDRRWASGNLQWRHLLGDPRLSRLGRFQMVQAMAHYLLGPVWFALLPLAALNAATGGAEGTPRGALLALLLAAWAALHAPRLLGHLALRTSWGAVWREGLFLQFFDGLLAFEKTLTVAASLRGHRRPGWPAQRREGGGVGWGEARARLWPHTLAGAVILALLLLAGSPFAVLAALPAYAGMLLAIPFCVWTARPADQPPLPLPSAKGTTAA